MKRSLFCLGCCFFRKRRVGCRGIAVAFAGFQYFLVSVVDGGGQGAHLYFVGHRLEVIGVGIAVVREYVHLDAPARFHYSYDSHKGIYRQFVVDDEHLRSSVVKVAGGRRFQFMSAKNAPLLVHIVFYAKQVGSGGYKITFVAVVWFAGYEVGLIVAQRVACQSCHLLAFRGGVALDDALVPFVSHVLADAVLVVGHEDALAVASVLGVELHRGVEGGAAAGEEVEDGGIL